mmetsp:Transcript_57919/g.160238  ORF Transcript_57919/g.160238 Transcript_57919/m.160238 type:complete len:282 (+) Transcript_57919:524-1369(+)
MAREGTLPPPPESASHGAYSESSAGALPEEEGRTAAETLVSMPGADEGDGSTFRAAAVQNPILAAIPRYLVDVATPSMRSGIATLRATGSAYVAWSHAAILSGAEDADDAEGQWEAVAMRLFGVVTGHLCELFGSPEAYYDALVRAYTEEHREREKSAREAMPAPPSVATDSPRGEPGTGAAGEGAGGRAWWPQGHPPAHDKEDDYAAQERRRLSVAAHIAARGPEEAGGATSSGTRSSGSLLRAFGSPGSAQWNSPEDPSAPAFTFQQQADDGGMRGVEA